MARDRRRPKRLGVVARLIDEYPDQVEYELIRHGERLRQLGTPRLSWHDVWLICAHADPGGPLASVLDPHGAWTSTDLLLRSMEHTLRVLAWQQTVDGHKGRNPPTPIPVGPEAPKPASQFVTLPLDEMRTFWAEQEAAQLAAAAELTP